MNSACNAWNDSLGDIVVSTSINVFNGRYEVWSDSVWYTLIVTAFTRVRSLVERENKRCDGRKIGPRRIGVVAGDKRVNRLTAIVNGPEQIRYNLCRPAVHAPPLRSPRSVPLIKVMYSGGCGRLTSTNCWKCRAIMDTERGPIKSNKAIAIRTRIVIV